ncbi:hypothetical protein DFQ26_004934 [Actinomortierella ambigua]|nr:hypothetical protein DFQ26_004934 [Actinomortierella ambigua]
MSTTESTSSPRDQLPPSQDVSTSSNVAVQQHRPSEQFTNMLLAASGTAFVAGIFGSLWYQGRKTRQRGIHRAAAAAAANTSTPAASLPVSSSLNGTSADGLPRKRLQSLQDVKATEALLREGRLLGVKAFAIATALCLSGAVVIVGTARWALDVQTIPEFSAKMRDLFPKQRAKFVGAVVDADQAVFGSDRKQQQQEQHEHHERSLSEGAITSAGSQEEEVDLDHEQDSNLLSRIERDLKKLAEDNP